MTVLIIFALRILFHLKDFFAFLADDLLDDKKIQFPQKNLRKIFYLGSSLEMTGVYSFIEGVSPYNCTYTYNPLVLILNNFNRKILYSN
jgi:hypothetical protein